MTTLTTLAVSAQALLIAIRDNPGAGSKTLAGASGKVANNIARDLDVLANAGLIERHPPRITRDGLAALNAIARANGVRDGAAAPAAESELVGLRHDQLVPNPLNPRKDFDDEAIDLLRQSILQDGLLQNLVVRPAATLPGGEKLFHAIVAGESRWRTIGAAIQDGDWPEDRLIPCKIIDVDDQRHSELALIENLRRRDLKPFEEARAFRTLHEVYKVPTAQIAERVATTQRFIQQRLQLLQLDDDDQQRLDAGEISIEDARRLASQPKPEPVVLTSAELLVMAEVAHKWTHAPKRRGDYYVKTEIAAGVKDEALDRLRKLQFVSVEVDTHNTERTYVTKAYRWPDPKDLELPEIPKGTAIYRTPWLNGPFEIPTEGKKRLAEKATRTAATKAANKIAREKARQLAADVAALAQEPQPWSTAVAGKFAALMRRAGSGFPWSIDDKNAVRAEGKSYGVGVNMYGVDPSLARLIVMAVNAAGGAPPEAGTVEDASS